MILFSERIKKIRNDLEMNKAQFAAHIGTSPSNITRYEKGDMNISISTLEEISEKLEISPSWLLGWSNAKYYTDKPDYKIVPIISFDKAKLKSIMHPDNYDGFEIVGIDRDPDFCTKINNEEMSKTGINDSSTVFFKKQDEYKNGDLVGVLRSDFIIVRRYYKDGAISWLRQESSKFVDEEFSEDERIVGKVIFIITEVY